MEAKTTQPTADLLKSRAYVLYWLSSLLSNIGTWMQQVAQPWIILSISHSSFLVGVDSFFMNAPSWIFTLWGGLLADRMDRKKVILLFQSIQFFSAVVLLILLITSHLHVWMILVISLIVGTTDSLSMPSFQSIIPSIVDSKDIPRAVALNSTQFNLSRMLGPALAGLIMVRFGAIACFGANVFSYVPFFISIFWIYPKKRSEIKKEYRPQLPATHLHDFKTLLGDPKVRVPLMTIFVTSFFCAPLMIFCPVLIKEVFHAEVGEFGGIMAAFGLGGLLGAGISLFSFPTNFKKGRMTSVTAIILGMIVIAVALSRSLPVLAILMILAGTTLTVSNISANSFLQANANNHTRGKIVSLFQLSLQGGISLGGLLTGFTSSQMGIAHALIMNGFLAIALQITILVLRYHPRPSIV